MKKPDLKKASLIFLSAGVGYLYGSIGVFLFFGPFKISILGLPISFSSLINPVLISFSVIALGILIRLSQFWTENPRERVLPIKKRETCHVPRDTTGIVLKYPFWILMGITVLGGVVRYWGIHFGLPGTVSRPDEEFIVATALQFFKGDFNPGFFNYPTLYMYLLHGLYRLYFLVTWVSGTNLAVPDLRIEFQDLSEFYLMNRGLSALLGTASIVILYQMARLLFGRATAVLSSLFLALVYLHVRDSHFGVTDVSMTFFVLCAVLFMIKSYQEKSLVNYCLAGLMAGLASSTKYNGFLLMGSMGLVHWLIILEEGASWKKIFFDERMMLFASLMAFGFLLGTPFAFLEPQAFIRDFSSEIKHLREGHLIILGRGWWHHVRFSLFYGLGGSLFVFSLLGMGTIFVRHFKKGVILCSFPVLYFILMGRGYTVFARYVVPMVPFLCLTGAFFTVALMEQLAKYFRPLLGKVFGSMVILLLIGPTFRTTMQCDHLLAQTDNRLLVKQWAQNHIPEGSSVYQTGHYYGKVQLYPWLGFLKTELDLSLNQPERKWIIQAMMEYIEKNRLASHRELSYNESLKKFYFQNVETGNLPEYILLIKYPLVVYNPVPEEIIQLCHASYRLIKTFEAIDSESRDNVFDQQDAFYLPFYGFHKIRRPGPNIYIFNKITTSLDVKKNG